MAERSLRLSASRGPPGKFENRFAGLGMSRAALLCALCGEAEPRPWVFPRKRKTSGLGVLTGEYWLPRYSSQAGRYTAMWEQDTTVARLYQVWSSSKLDVRARPFCSHTHSVSGHLQ